jgi:hypothetical protein
MAVSPAVAALRPSMLADHARVTPVTVVCSPVIASPAAKDSAPPASQSLRRPKRLRERSHSAPHTGRAMSETSPARALTTAKPWTLDAGSMISNCWGSSSCRGTRLAIQYPNQTRPNRVIQPRETGSVGA